MSFENRETGKLRADSPGSEHGLVLLSTSTLMGNDVYNQDEENLGDIKDFMLDIHSGKIGYAVLSFGGFLGLGEKLFAVPWSALTLDAANKRFILDVDIERLKNAPGFDKDHWPDMADPSWAQGVNNYYGAKSDTGTSAAPPV